jgi:hypothetical protein
MTVREVEYLQQFVKVKSDVLNIERIVERASIVELDPLEDERADLRRRVAYEVEKSNNVAAVREFSQYFVLPKIAARVKWDEDFDCNFAAAVRKCLENRRVLPRPTFFSREYGSGGL